MGEKEDVGHAKVHGIHDRDHRLRAYQRKRCDHAVVSSHCRLRA